MLGVVALVLGLVKACLLGSLGVFNILLRLGGKVIEPSRFLTSLLTLLVRLLLMFSSTVLDDMSR